MSIEPSLAACVDSYAAKTVAQHQTKFGAAPLKSISEVKASLSSLWAQLLAYGAQIDWAKVYAEIMPIIGMFFAGKTVPEVLAYVLSLLGLPATPVTPAPVVP